MEGIHVDERDTNITAAIIHLNSYVGIECNCRRGRKSGTNTIFEGKECEVCTRLLL